jgi:thiosulfate/3-mercaptopyruvate sulfurtransferase
VIPPIVGPEWLAENLDAVVVCEVGSEPADAHVPGARFVSIDRDLAADPGPVVGRHPLPSPAAFAERLGAVGIGDGATTIAYDGNGGAHAGRLVWMLRILGQEAALLDGGFSSWTGPTESDWPVIDPVDRSVLPWPAEALADADEVAEHLAAGGTVIDSRAAERYRGEVEPLDAVAGHIPGAVNLPFQENLAAGRFRSPAELRERFSAVAEDPTPIVYCGSGVTACHNALAMEHAGLPRPRVYVGSWSGWSTDPSRPIG